MCSCVYFQTRKYSRILLLSTTLSTTTTMSCTGSLLTLITSALCHFRMQSIKFLSEYTLAVIIIFSWLWCPLHACYIQLTQRITYTRPSSIQASARISYIKRRGQLLTFSPCTHTLDFSRRYCSRPAPMIRPLGSNTSWIYFPNRLELSLRAVWALPNASRMGFSCEINWKVHALGRRVSHRYEMYCNNGHPTSTFTTCHSASYSTGFK